MLQEKNIKNGQIIAAAIILSTIFEFIFGCRKSRPGNQIILINLIYFKVSYHIFDSNLELKTV